MQWFVGFGAAHNLNIKSSYVSSHRLDADLLVLGPCEPLWMVSPKIISQRTGLSCYNLANSHSDFADNFLHLHLYLKNNRPPAYLLLFVTPESFDLRYNTFYSYRFSPFLSDRVVASTVAECDPAFGSWMRFPFLRYGYYSHQTIFPALQGWKHYLTGKKLPYYPDGFEPPARMVWDNHYTNLVRLYPRGYSFEWDTMRKKYLDKILDLCAEKRIRVVLYESPVLQEIRDYQYNRLFYLDKIKSIADKRKLIFLRFDELGKIIGRKNFISPMVTTVGGSLYFSDTLGRRLHGIIDQ